MNRSITTVLSGMFGLLTAGALGLAPRTAHACSCALGMEGFVAPANGETGVPRNTRLWVGAFVQDVTLTGPNNQTVALSRGILRGNNRDVLAVFTPAALLEPSAAYVFNMDGQMVSFTTSNASDVEAPAEPVVSPLESSFARDTPSPIPVSSCGNGGHAYDSFSVQHNGLFTLVEIDTPEQLDESTITGSVGDIASITGGDVFVGRGICLFNWDGADEGESTNVRFATVDVAGNFSGWTEPSQATIETNGGCAQASSSSLGVLAVLALPLRRRTRRQPGERAKPRCDAGTR
jgi:hypothetical protein